MPDDSQVMFKSPTTGKVQAVPPGDWEELINAGYTPTTHKIMYSPGGKRAMVPNEEMKDYMKQGFQTAPKTQFEKNVTGEGFSLKGAPGAALSTVSKIPGAMLQQLDPTRGLTGAALTGLGVNPRGGTMGERLGEVPAVGAAREAASEYQKSRQEGINPLQAGLSAGMAGAGSLLGVSNEQQRALAEQGEGGQISGQSVVPAAMAAAPLARGAIKATGIPGRIAEGLRTEEGTGPIKPGVRTTAKIGGMALGHATHIPGLGELGGYVLGPEIAETIIPRKGGAPPVALESPESILAERQKRMAAYAEMNEDFANRTKQAIKDSAKRVKDAEDARQKEITDWAKLDKVSEADHAAFQDRVSELEGERQKALADQERLMQQHAEALNRRGAVKQAKTTVGATPSPEGRPSGLLPPPILAEPVLSKPTVGSEVAAKTKSSILSRGSTVYQLGEEPNPFDPVHEKIINDLQTRSGPELRKMAKAGDRFAAFVLRNMPRPSPRP